MKSGVGRENSSWCEEVITAAKKLNTVQPDVGIGLHKIEGKYRWPWRCWQRYPAHALEK